MSRLLSLAALALGLSVAAPARAEGFAVARFEPSERGSDWFVADSLDLRARPGPSAGATLDYAYKPLAVYDAAGNERVALVRHQLLTHAGGSYVLAERVRLAASVPFAMYQDGESATVNGERLSAATKSALGDLRLAADLRVAGRYRDPLAVAAGLRAWVPLGSRDQFMSDGTFRIAPQLLASGEKGGFVWALRAGYAFRPGAEAYAGTSLRHELFLCSAVGMRVGSWVVGPEIFAAGALEDMFGPSSTPVDAVLGVHHSLAWGLDIAAAIGGGLSSGYGSPAFRALVSMEWRTPIPPPPPPPDEDRFELTEPAP